MAGKGKQSHPLKDGGSKMQYRKFILSLTDDGAQEAELNRFLRGHRILKVEQHFMEADALWAFLVSYMDGEQRDSAAPVQRSGGEKYDPSKELNAQQLARYQRYAAVRLQLAKRDNVKAFIVFTNRELGEIAKAEELSLEVLRRVNGVGDERIAKYGEEFVRMVAEGDAFDQEKPFGDAHETSGARDGEGGAD